METLRLQVTGMTCAACSARIEKGLRRMNGVHRAAVNMATGQAFVEFDPRATGERSIRDKLEQLGYGAEEGTRSPHEVQLAEIRSLGWRFAVALAVSWPLFWGMLAHLPFEASIRIPSAILSPFLQWALASVLLFYVGFPFYRGAYAALKQGSANMDVLVALSSSVAYFYSHYKLFESSFEISHDQLYFDAIAMIVSVVLLGKLLEARAKGKALKDLNDLYGLQIRYVRVRRGSAEDWIPAEDLRAGEQVVVLAGEWFSADGTILSGSAEADEALLTGESMPVLKRKGDYVYSGTLCLNGQVVIRADKDAGETRLNRMITIVEEAQSLKPAIARKVDRAAAVFVPVMIACAAAAYAGWMLWPDTPSGETALRYALAVLLIACPCALGLAAPVSILVATALAAKRGILFKQGGAMETLAKVDRVLFDKTGTLTEGRPRLQAIQAYAGSSSYLLRMAASVERFSSHPLARAIREAAERQGVVPAEATQTVEIPGGGLEGVVEGKRVRVGHPEWAGNGAAAGEYGWAAGPGETVLVVSIDQRPAGLFRLSDAIRDDAAETVRELRGSAEVAMVTGDQPIPANRIAEQTGIAEVHAACSPERKAELVRESRVTGRAVAFVGDGHNDAAALATADVGIAMSGGAGAAMRTGDVVLTRDRLTGILDAIAISRAALRNIKQNIGFAIAYNAVAVPLAAFGYLDPRVACMGMAASSVIVVSNALRLQRIRLRSGRAE